ncbi:MAG TPA: hypothetical protein VGR98_27995 [Streptosporangiaceae bacterium]|nr:hypothetical protein [Streptosporangiaceae bacterium]
MTSAPIRPGAVTITLDGSGNGTAKIGPAGMAEVWQAAVASVSASTNGREAQCKVYVGDQPTAANFIDQTLSGSTGDSTGRVSARPLRLGDYVWAVWAGGDPGAVATLNVTGTRDV